MAAEDGEGFSQLTKETHASVWRMDMGERQEARIEYHVYVSRILANV